MTWIYDGDTFAATTEDGEIDVRLLGVNAPEEGECLHDEATGYLIEVLKEEEVALEVIGTDQFGRTLAHVWWADSHINLDLVDLGLAIATTPDDDEPYGRELIDAEESAWERRTGLWATDTCGASGPVPDMTIESGVFNPPGPDDEVLADETITILNRGQEPVDLTGWILRDESSRHRYTFPNGTKVQPGEDLTVTSADPGWDPGGGSVWNNDGDQALLLDDHGRVVDRWRY